MPVSVGIPFYNAEKYLADAIRSVFAQTYQDWELILIDDGSTDRSLEIALAVNDLRVRVISDGKNRKLPYRLNQLVDESRYEIIARMDADDMMAPSRLEKQLCCFDNPKIDLIGTIACVIDAESAPFGLRGNEGKITSSNIFRSRALLHPSIMARKQWFIENRYDTNMIRCEDTELWCRALSMGRLHSDNMHIIPEPLLFYRSEGVNLSAENLAIIYPSAIKRIREFGPAVFGRLGTQRELWHYRAKHFIRGIALRIGLQQQILKQRNRPICDSAVLEQVNADIRFIQNIDLPCYD